MYFAFSLRDFVNLRPQIQIKIGCFCAFGCWFYPAVNKSRKCLMSLIEISCFSSGLCRKLPCDEYSRGFWLSFHANLPCKLNFGSKILNNFKQVKQISRYQPNLKCNLANKLCFLVCVLFCAKICSGLKAQICRDILGVCFG